MQVKAKLKNLRISPRKVRLTTDLIKGMNVDEALIQLSATVKRSNTPIEKLLKSAIANAENNFGLEKSNLYISDVQVGEGPILKRWMPRAYGRATEILKRTSIVFMTLEEKVEQKKEVQEDKGKVEKSATETKKKEDIENKKEEKTDKKEDKEKSSKDNN